MGCKLRLVMIAWLLGTTSPAMASIAVETTSIGHGVKVWYAQNNAAPVVDVVLSFEGAGSASDPEGKGGRAAFAAAMLTEGAATLDSAAFRRALEERAISLTVDASDDHLQIHIYCLRDQAERAGELLAMALGKPRLEPPDQARIKSDITSVIARLDERPGYRASRLLITRAFKGHPYANAAYGDAVSVASLNEQDVRDFMRTYMTRGNVMIAASGDVDSRLLDAMLEPVVDALADNDSGAVAVTQTTLLGSGETLRQTMPVPQTTVVFAAPAIARNDARFYAQYLLNDILGGSALYSRLGEQVRQQKGLVYAIDTDLDMKRGAAVIFGSLATRNATTDEAITQVKSVLDDMHKKGVTTQECDDAKSKVLGAFARRLDGSSAVTTMLIAMQIHNLGEDYMEKRAELFGQVSCGDINAVAADILNPANFLFAVVGGSPDVGGTGPVAVSPSGRSDVK